MSTLTNQNVMPPDDSVSLAQPPGLYLLFLVEMWERFSYYGMRALLVLYLIQSISDHDNPGRGWRQGEANLLYGWYTGLAYLLPLLGGYLADKFLGTHRSMLIGGIVIALGHIVLGLTGMGDLGHSEMGMTLFIGGLVLIILGTGYFKPCVSVMVGQLYGPTDARRDGGFTIFYIGINVGAFLCAFVCGTLGEQVGWHWGFGSAAVGMIAGLITYLVFRPMFLRNIGLPPADKTSPVVPVLFMIGTLVVAAAVTVLYHGSAFGYLAQAFRDLRGNDALFYPLVAVLSAVILGLVTWFVAIQAPGEKGPTASIFLFMLFNAFFWIAAEQAGSTLNVFAKDNTDRALFNWEVPATWFQSINPLLIVVLAPFFAALWPMLARRRIEPTQPVKIALGLLFLGGGYVFMVFAARLSDQGVRVGMFWLVATYTLHTLGELCLSPTGLSYVTKAAPVRFVALLMGIWFISSFLANLGGGIVASYVEAIERGEIELPWFAWGLRLGGLADYFMLFVISSFGTGFLILFTTPLLRKLLPPSELDQSDHLSAGAPTAETPNGILAGHPTAPAATGIKTEELKK